MTSRNKLQIRTTEAEAFTDLVLEVFSFNGLMLNAGNSLAKPFGLTSARWQVMGAIDLAGQPLSAAQIARRMGLARQGVLRIGNDLVEMGMLEAGANPDHKRASLYAITERGREVMLEIDQAQAAWANEMSNEVDPQVLEAATMLLKQLSDKAKLNNQS
jgi:DNA-binding MarR family transcriptional regulator